MRTDQPNPTRGSAYRMTSGKTMPPVPPAVQTTPVASARRLPNHWPVVAMQGLKRSEAERPPRTENVRKNW